MTVPTTQDLEGARDDALLQLKIGRAAHGHAIAVALLGLALPAGILLVTSPTLPAGGTTNLRATFFLAFVALGGLDLALAGLLAKWEAYQLWPWEPHFWLTVLSVVLNVAVVVVFSLVSAGYAPVAGWPIEPWLFPVAMLGVAAPLVAMALTWHGWTPRKTLAVLGGLVPIVASVALFVPVASAADRLSDLVLGLFVSALFVLTSGSYLHLISSGTRTHEREVIHSGQTRLFHVADEVRALETTLRARESRLVEREANVEAAEATHRRTVQAHDDARAHVAELEQELKLRADELDQRQATFATRAAAANTQARTVQDRESELGLREQDLARDRAQVAARERAIADRETEARRLGLQQTERDRHLEQRLANLEERETRLEARRKDLEAKTSEMLKHESELRTRDALGPAGASKPVAAAQLADLEARETRLAQLQITLDEQNVALGRKSRELDADREEVRQRDSGVVEREVAVGTREEGLRQREADAKETLEAAEARRLRYEEALKAFEEKVALIDRRDAEVGVRSDETARLQKSLQLREEGLARDRAQLEADRTALDAAQRAVRDRERRLASSAPASTTPAVPASAGTADTDSEPTAADETLAAASVRRFADRLSTGTPRLDDLLLGGLPPRSHVLLMGDTFVGKEVVLYAYIAEGLKRGEPVVLVTATRSPDEIAAQLTQVLPSFPEYETKGLVRWIDASQPAGTAGRPGARGAASVKGPEDHAGILSALVAATKSANGGTRVGILGLSASLAHADEKASSVFVQNLVGILKPRPALALYTVEAGTLPDAQVERLLTRMDGAIRFRQERDKTFLSVAGLGDVATRDWVECRATNRALVVGSFALERIR